jgi:hypothetical protein
VRCDDAARTLAELVDGAEVSPDARTAHIERCLRCQAELAQHRRIRRSMAQLRSTFVEPDPQLLVDIFESLADAGRVRAERSSQHRQRVAYLAAAATAATAAGAAGVLLASRSRRTRLSPTG